MRAQRPGYGFHGCFSNLGIKYCYHYIAYNSSYFTSFCLLLVISHTNGLSANLLRNSSACCNLHRYLLTANCVHCCILLGGHALWRDVDSTCMNDAPQADTSNLLPSLYTTISESSLYSSNWRTVGCSISIFAGLFRRVNIREDYGNVKESINYRYLCGTSYTLLLR